MADASSGARGLGTGRSHAPFLRLHDGGLELAPGITLIANVARADEPPHHLVRAPEGLAAIFAAAYGNAALGRSLFPVLARIASSLDARDGFIAWSIAREIVLPPLSDQALQRAARASDGRIERAWDDSLHPRHPAGSPGGAGGEFAPAGGGSLLVPVAHRKPPSRRLPPRDHNNPPPDRPPQFPLAPERRQGPGASDADEPPEDRERSERLSEQGFPKTLDELRISRSNHAYSSHDQIIRQNGSAGPGKQYHHVVEQHPRNVERFGPFEIHNNDNVIILPRGVHESISGHYSSKPEWMKGKTVRDWLADKSYEEQYRYGMERLRKAGVLK